MTYCSGCGRTDMAGITHICPPIHPQRAPEGGGGVTCKHIWRRICHSHGCEKCVRCGKLKVYA